MRARWAPVAAVAILSLVLPSASAASRNKGEFLALSYNVAGLPQGVSGSDPATNSRLISPLLNAYDVVLLQEDWRDPVEAAPVLFFHDDIVSEANHPHRSEPAPPPMGTDLRRTPPHHPPLIADGLNQLSDFPFAGLQRHMWNECNGEFAVAVVEAILEGLGADDAVDDAGLGDVVDGGAADCGAQKGFTVSRLRLADGVEIDLYNLHADAGGDDRDAAARTSNYTQLANFMRAYSLGRAVVLAGDTNLHTGPAPDEAKGRKIWGDFQAETGLSDVCRVLDCGGDAGEIDKFAFRSGAGVQLTPLSHQFERERFKRDDGEPLSDHDALAVRFAWKRRPT